MQTRSDKRQEKENFRQLQESVIPWLTEVLDYIVSRYGEFVLLKPRMSLRNALLWGTPLLLLLLGGFVLIRAARSGKRPEPKSLDDRETAALDDILRRDGPQ